MAILIVPVKGYLTSLMKAVHLIVGHVVILTKISPIWLCGKGIQAGTIIVFLTVEQKEKVITVKQCSYRH